MREEERILLKAASILLGYPDAALAASLDSVREVLEEQACSPAAAKLLDTVAMLRGTPLLQLQEEYTRLFDFDPSTSLNLTYHKWGDGKERGGALTRFKQAYTKEGFALTGGELPDFLPLVLEFLSICPDDEFVGMLDEYAEGIENLACRLEDAGSGYARCVRVPAELPSSGRQTAAETSRSGASARETSGAYRRSES